MIKVQDWMASIPDEEKHVAYVGEGKCVKKEFLLCGDGWEEYKDWTFFLDMTFDAESITTRDSRQVVSTRINRSEIDEVTGVTADETMFKETYTVHDEDVLDYDLTDIASLTKSVGKDGLHLTWTVLRQHTVLPGKLWATLRAVSGEIDEAQIAWLKEYLAGHDRPVLLGAHHPLKEMPNLSNVIVESECVAGYIYGHNHIWNKSVSILRPRKNLHMTPTLALPATFYGDIGLAVMTVDSKGAVVEYSSKGFWWPQPVENPPAEWLQRQKDLENEKCTFLFQGAR
jgi:hypothetical protein